MKRTLGALAAGLIVLSSVTGWATEQKATVYTVDGQKLIGTISEDEFGINTPYGMLNVPTKDLIALYPGFRVGETTRKRIANYIAQLTTANKDSAVKNLVYMGRIAVPQLQAAAESENKKLAGEVKALLKKTWPSGAKVPHDGAGILRTRTMELRGTLTFLRIKVKGSFGTKTIHKPGIRLIQFTRGKVQPADDTPTFPAVKGGRDPLLELVMKDSSRIIGTVDSYSLSVDTDYGKLSVPVKEFISVTLGDPDQFVTRAMSFVGKLSTTTLNVKSKVGTFRLDRDKVLVVKAQLEDTGTPVAKPDEGGVKSDQWTQIFNGKDLTGWSKWGKDAGKIKVANKSVHLFGDAGATYQKTGEMKDVMLAAQVRIGARSGQGAGLKLTLRDSPQGTYYLHFTGNNGTLFKWDNQAKQSTTLKNFQVEKPEGHWHYVWLGIRGNLLFAYVNGKLSGSVTLPAQGALPPGKVGIGVYNCDASFRDIRAKTLTQ